MDGPILQVFGKGASWAAGGKSFCPQPVGEPGHVTIAVERVRYQVKALKGHEGIERSGGDAGDLVGVQRQSLQVHEAVEDFLVDHLDRVFCQNSAKEKIMMAS